MSSIRRGACALALGALTLASGCDQKKDVAAPAPTGIPPLEQPSAAAGKPTDRPVHEPAAAPDNLPPGHPPVAAEGGGAMAGGAAATGGFQGETPGGAFDPKTLVAGVIKVDSKLKSKIAVGDVIFVVARKYEEGSTAPGTPLAVKKLTVDKFPLAFSLDSRDAMLVGTKLAGKVIVTARVDKDGDAITKNPGDVTGQSKPIEPPQKNVLVQLDKVL